jgi:RES domain-containing protein
MAYQPLIASGLGPKGFLKCMKQVQHPAAAPPPMPATWVDALETLLTHRETLLSWRESQMEQIRRMASQLQSHRDAWRSELHPDVHQVIGHLHLPLLQWLVEDTNFPDSTYVTKLCLGKPALGEIPATGLFRAERSEAEMELAEWTSNPKARNAKLIEMVQASGDIALDMKAWDKLQKELSMQYCVGPGELSDLDLNSCCITPRWPKWEEKEDGTWSCRNISDWKASGGNKTVTLQERYSPEDLTTAHAVLRIFSEVFPTADIYGYRIDWEMAFRQDPLWPGHAHLHYEVVWNPHLQRVQWVRPLGGAFGSKAAQLNFVQHPHFICHVVRRKLAILLCHYSDDMWGFEPAAAATQAHNLVCELMDLIGWRWDAKKSPPASSQLRLLGVEHSLGRSCHYVWLAETKIKKLLDALQNHRDTSRMTSADASSLHGAFTWVRSTLWGRAGAAVLAPLRARQKVAFHALNSALRAMLDWLELALVHENRRRVPCSIHTLELVVTVSDGEGTGHVAVGKWNVDRDGSVPQITTCTVPTSLLAKWSANSSAVIAQIEAVGPLLALATWEDLRHKLWIHFIDNTAAKDSLIKGSSINAELNELMHATWKEVRCRRLHLWVEYVHTQDNPIDKASRGCIADLYGEKGLWRQPGDWVDLLCRYIHRKDNINGTTTSTTSNSSSR